jgi:uncharacterized membrane protein
MDYIETRLKPQMDYYSNKCSSLQKEYYRLSLVSIVVNAIIPIFTMATDSFFLVKYIIAALSAVATITSSILLLRKTKDTWVEYRSTYEQLKREKIMFEMGVGEYSSQDEDRFIMNCENIMNNEHSAWSQRMKETSKK